MPVAFRLWAVGLRRALELLPWAYRSVATPSTGCVLNNVPHKIITYHPIIFLKCVVTIVIYKI